MEEIFMKKKKLRKDILGIRNEMDLKDKSEKDKSIAEKFINSDYYKKAQKIFIYISYSSEIDTKQIINKAISDGKIIYVPRTIVSTKVMDAVKINSLDNLQKDKYGILEPSHNEPYINPDELDLIIVPGVAFDRNGGRIGYGAGYYDRYFKRISKNIKKVALAYDFQIVDNVPMDKQDVHIDYIITDKEIIKE